MMIRFPSPAAKLALAIALIAASLFLTIHIVRGAYVEWCLDEGSKDRLLAAIKLDSKKCRGYYYLGLNYLYSLQDLNPERGEEFLRQAIRCQPLDSLSWLSLASALNAEGRTEEAAVVAERATALNPRNSVILWGSGNILLFAGKTDLALEMMRRALEGAPEYAQPAFNLYWKASGDGEKILSLGVPNTVELNLAYLNFLVSPGIQRVEEAHKVWDRLLALGEQFPAERSFAYLDALINSGRTAEAIRAWDQMVLLGVLPREHLRVEPNLVVNSSFEAPPVKGGFDWRIVPVAGVSVDLDLQTHHDGSRSLVINFEGLSNLDFHHLGQVVAVNPNSKYFFRAFEKSRALTTLSGPHWEIYDMQDPKRGRWETQDVLGTKEWSEQRLEFKTGPQTRVLVIRLHRKPAVELDKRIEGTLWVDEVKLIPLVNAP